MPKRPCAVTLTMDDSTILCADKFGDVYSLPVIGQPYESMTRAPVDQNTSSHRNENASQVEFVPVASSLTVHTKGNREALRQQQRVRKLKPPKKCLNFDHRLILGHVSLLTDVIYTSMPTPSGRPRDFILTSDRDEHIRVSRGIRQAHIIEGYCLGHTDFVSKLCVPPDYPHLLISGGGDECLILWNWLLGTVRQRIDLKHPIEVLMETYGQGPMSTESVFRKEECANSDKRERKFSVSNIIAPKKSRREHQAQVIITCEGYVPRFQTIVSELISF